ncbi:2260_t:CDS:2 [Entrophospora sp. SA101]|nr:2260_t:CDS:2 [Entrophospora sp. SA101]
MLFHNINKIFSKNSIDGSCSYNGSCRRISYFISRIITSTTNNNQTSSLVFMRPPPLILLSQPQSHLKPLALTLSSTKKSTFLKDQQRMIGSQSDKPKKSKVYTRTGDKGTSSLYNGERRSKDDPIFDALGTIDELNSSIGIANFYCKKAGNSLIENLIEIQCNLIQVMSNVATPRSNSNDSKINYTSFEEENIAKLESLIDKYDSASIKTYTLHTERVTTPLVVSGTADQTVGKYLNRLSDFFFVAARYASQFEDQTENIYIQKNLVTRDLKKE